MDYTAYHYSDALLPLKYNICGVELRPLCLGHLMILEKLNNPLLSDKENDYDMGEGMIWFFSAILTCALSYEDNIEILNDEEKHKKVMDEFVLSLLKNMEKEDTKWNIYAKMNLFKEYLAYYMDVPIYTEEHPSNNTGLPSGTDWKQNIYLIFKRMGYTDKEIYNMNIRRLFYEWCSYAESEGGIKVMNKYDLQILGKL